MAKKKKPKSTGTGDTRKDSSVKKRLTYEGTVVDPIKDILFHVHLDDNNQIVLGYLSGNMRRNRIRVMLGDRVLIEINDFDSKKGRILYRIDDHQAKKDPDSPGSLLDMETINSINSNPLIEGDQKDSQDTNPNQDLDQDLTD